MATGSTVTHDYISSISGECIVSQVRYGSNGAVDGVAEYQFGGSTSSQLEGRKIWDNIDSDGLDSTPVAIQLVVQANGGANSVEFTVAGSETPNLLYGGRTYGVIQKVVIRAAVRIPAKFIFQNLKVQFFRSGRVTEQLLVAAGPQVDSTSAASPYAAEQILTVTPGFANNTKVVVSAQVQLICGADYVPEADDLFGDIRVYAATCTAS